MILHIDSSGFVSSGTGSIGAATLSYSIDGGNTFTNVYYLYGNGSFGPQTNTISLSNSQDLTKIQVQAKILTDSSGSGASATQNIIEIWITGSEP